MKRLATERLDLAPCTLADTPELWAVWTDPDVRRFLWDDRVIPLERTHEFVVQSLEAARASGLGLWMIRLRGEGAIIGFCGLRRTAHSEVELLYGLTPPCWGRGLATEAARAVLRHAFDDLGLERVVAATDPPNRSSVRVLERLGMTARRAGPAEAAHLVHFEIARQPAAAHPSGEARRSPP